MKTISVLVHRRSESPRFQITPKLVNEFKLFINLMNSILSFHAFLIMALVQVWRIGWEFSGLSSLGSAGVLLRYYHSFHCLHQLSIPATFDADGRPYHGSEALR